MRPTVEFIAPDAGRDWVFHARSGDAFDFSWHAHDFYELTVIAAGRGRRFTGDSASPYGPGDVALFGPRLPHTYASARRDGPHLAYVAQFPGSLVDGLVGGAEFGALRSLLRASARGVTDAAPGQSWVRAARRLAGLDGARQTVGLFDLLVRLAESRSTVTLASAGSARPVAPARARALNAVVRYVDERFRQPVTRDGVAAEVSMSPSSVSRLVRDQLGTTLTGYVTSVRVAAAARALVDSDRSVAGIAHDCGFANLANFNRQFRRAQGMTPTDYRRAFTGTAGR
ncbi:helix-turn-helix domain-containing protein [Rugosimonospora africana]|uniref:AraC family transcriptional regulator n=1 Tax=Rugosimonospora africana TaxID=556532 RepID=A0A8J3R1J0_9ACTN|nr:AraC family transcriptional regulator [Rugosimonospora africana]GIH20099.1 AraC family transcriptional regulator [Rugosimonospora africana]